MTDVSRPPTIAPPSGPRATVRLERVSTSEALVRALTRQILDGTLPAGTWLREVELAEKHGVSRQSLRAALVELVHLGLLQREPHRGVWVPVMTADDVRDLYYVRSLIEVEAARVVATRPEAWPALEEVVQRLERLSPESSGHEMVDADFEFHRALVSGVGSARLSRSHEMLCSEIRLSFVSTVREDGPTYLFGEHRALLGVLQRGDPAAAAERIAEHLAEGMEVTLAGIASAPPRVPLDDGTGREPR
jgi:DNA-binding GntR family transcriptional regulator